jgi:hypothetical protein
MVTFIPPRADDSKRARSFPGSFWNWPVLASVNIPEGVTRIGDMAFFGCLCLTGACFLDDAPILGSNVFLDVSPGFMVYCLRSRS